MTWLDLTQIDFAWLDSTWLCLTWLNLTWLCLTWLDLKIIFAILDLVENICRLALKNLFPGASFQRTKAGNFLWLKLKMQNDTYFPSHPQKHSNFRDYILSYPSYLLFTLFQDMVDGRGHMFTLKNLSVSAVDMFTCFLVSLFTCLLVYLFTCLLVYLL